MTIELPVWKEAENSTPLARHLISNQNGMAISVLVAKVAENGRGSMVHRSIVVNGGPPVEVGSDAELFNTLGDLDGVVILPPGELISGIRRSVAAVAPDALQMIARG